MKKKTVKISLISFSVIFLCVVLYFICAFFGNPVSYLLSKKSADDYIAEKYSDYNLKIEEIGYDLKSSGYYAYVVSLDSIDTRFSVYFDLLGRPVRDSFENVTSGWNTAMRLENQYRELVDSVEDEINDKFKLDFYFGEIKTSEISDDYVGKEPYGLKTSELKLDYNYDINKVASEAGHIVFYYEETELTAEKAAEKLLELKKIFDKNNIKFYAIDFIAQEPKTEDNLSIRKEFAIREFLYSDIYDNNLAERLQEAADDLKQYYSKEEVKK